MVVEKKKEKKALLANKFTTVPPIVDIEKMVEKVRKIILKGNSVSVRH